MKEATKKIQFLKLNLLFPRTCDMDKSRSGSNLLDSSLTQYYITYYDQKLFVWTSNFANF